MTVMKIVLCDDDIKDLTKIAEMVSKYIMLYPEKNFEMEKYSDPSTLSDHIAGGDVADVYILDMLMPAMTGIELGNQIRKLKGKSAIIYITSSDDYALDAYGVFALRYILKPVREDKLFEALDYSLYNNKETKDSIYLVKMKGRLAQVRYSEIEYIENSNRRLEVHTVNGEIFKSLVLRKSFEEETQELAGEDNFGQVHKSFLVNFDYVKQLMQNTIVMKSGRKVPVSKARATKVKREYLLFISNKYN